VQDQTGRTVRLQPGKYRATRLQEFEEFTPEAVAGLTFPRAVSKLGSRRSACTHQPHCNCRFQAKTALVILYGRLLFCGPAR
jgi:hypothetical protein